MSGPWLRTLTLGAALVLAGCAHCGEPMAVAPATELPTVATASGAASLAAAPSPCPEGSALTARGTCVPKAWHCSPLYYGTGDGCDCDCGTADPDCQGTPTAFFCYNAGTPQKVASCAACTAPRAAAVASPAP